jgi:predicted ATPase
MIEKQIYIITGGPGFGKTLLIDELQKSGYLCSGEFARDLIDSQVHIGGDILPWKRAKLFQQTILNQRIAFFDAVPDEAIAFADRGIPDQLAFARYKGFGAPEILVESARKYRYAPQVFVTPPWLEIFINDTIRTETFEEAVRIHQFVLETYSELNYQLVELPFLSVKRRMEYILQTILKIKHNEHQST